MADAYNTKPLLVVVETESKKQQQREGGGAGGVPTTKTKEPKDKNRKELILFLFLSVVGVVSVHSNFLYRRKYATASPTSLVRNTKSSSTAVDSNFATNTNNHSDKFGSLNNLHLAFVGDSLTRHQHLSLVHYLKWGHWNSHPGYIEGGYSTRFEHRTNISKTLNHSQACNCNRPEGNYMARKKLHLIYFNMYFRDDIRNNYVSLISKNGAAEAHGH